MKRRGMGKGRGMGYYNLVPRDSYVHSMSAKGVKTLPKELKVLENKFDKLDVEFHKISLEDEQYTSKEQKEKVQNKLRLKRLQELYPLKERLAKYKEPNPPKIESIDWNYTNYPIVYEAVRGYKGHIEWMTPDDYLKMAGQEHYTENEWEWMSEDNMLLLRKEILKTKRFDVGYLIVRQKGKWNIVIGQEGRHRALLAKWFGFEKIPVAIHGSAHDKFSVHSSISEGSKFGEMLLEDE